MGQLLATDITSFSRRDISDDIVIVDAKSTPLFSMIPKGSQKEGNLLMEWPVDKNLDPEHNAVPDGTDVTEFENPMAAYDQIRSYMQWFRPLKGWKLGKLAVDVQNLPGYKMKKATAIVKKMKQLKRQLECSMGSDLDTKAPTGALGGVSRGLGSWIRATAQAVLPVPTPYLTASGCIDTTASSSLTEAIVQDVMQASYNETGEKKVFAFVCGPNHKKRYEGFTRTTAGTTNVQASIRSFNQDGASKKIVATVDVFEGNFGTAELMESLWLAYFNATTPGTTAANDATQLAISQARCYGLDTELLSWVGKQAPQSEEYPNLGGGPSGQCDAIGGLQHANPRASIKFAPTS
jgi:hypothetical protein